MGEHDAPVSWWQRWSEAQPVRLYLYGLTVPVLGVCVVYGWVTTEQAGAWLAVSGALFGATVVGTELARKHIDPPAVVHAKLQQVDQRAYAEGHDDGARSIGGGVPVTMAMRQVGRCRHVQAGDRCVLPAHPETVAHQYE